MTLQWFGAILVITACTGVGFSIAAFHIKTEKGLQQLILLLELMKQELQFHLTPLPQLIRLAQEESRGTIHAILETLAAELESQTHSDASVCMRKALALYPQLPPQVSRNLTQLGISLGRFDLDGQLSGLDSVRQLCQRELDGLLINRDVRLRSYRTLGLCAGIALVILFI